MSTSSDSSGLEELLPEERECASSDCSTDYSVEHYERSAGIDVKDALFLKAGLENAVRTYNEALLGSSLRLAAMQEAKDADLSLRHAQVESNRNRLSSSNSDLKDDVRTVTSVNIDSVTEQTNDSVSSAPTPPARAAPSPCDWSILNQRLRAQGLREVKTLVSGAADDSSAFQAMASLLDEYMRRVRRDNEQARLIGFPSAQAKPEADPALEARVRHLEGARKALELQLAENAETAGQAKAKAAADLKRLAAEVKDLKLLLKQSEHKLRAGEMVSERLMEKLRQQVELEKSTRERDRLAFLRIQRRPPQAGRGNDAKFLELISAYESHRAASAAEVEALRGDIRRLNAHLREKENVILKHGYGLEAASGLGDVAGNSAGGTGAAAAALNDKCAALGRELHVARLREDAARAQHEAMAAEIGRLRDDVAELEADKENLSLELASRPTAKALQAAKAEAAALVARLATVDRELREAADLKALRRHATTKALVAVDRDNHRLALHAIDALPKEFTKEVLQAACRALRVSDVGLIVPSIEKLAAAVALLPRLERFARAVCSTLLPPEAGHHSGGGGEGEAGAGAGAGCAGGRVERRRVMEDALPVLERWRDLVGRVEQAGALKDALAAALSRRAHMQAVRARGLPAASAEAAAVAAAPAAGGQGGSRGGQGGQGDDDGYGGQTSQGDQGGHGLLAPRLTNAAVVKEVEELVALEAQLLSRHQSFAAAERALELNPDLINNRIVLHFQYLFQVKRLEGVFPKLNELFVFVSEVQSVLRALRSVCRLPVSASPKAILAAVQHLILDTTTPRSFPELTDRDGN